MGKDEEVNGQGGKGVPRPHTGRDGGDNAGWMRVLLPVRGSRSQRLESCLFDDPQREVEQVVTASEKTWTMSTKMSRGLVDTDLTTTHAISSISNKHYSFSHKYTQNT